jgi:hypothetical protein
MDDPSIRRDRGGSRLLGEQQDFGVAGLMSPAIESAERRNPAKAGALHRGDEGVRRVEPHGMDELARGPGLLEGDARMETVALDPPALVGDAPFVGLTRAAFERGTAVAAERFEEEVPSGAKGSGVVPKNAVVVLRILEIPERAPEIEREVECARPFATSSTSKSSSAARRRASSRYATVRSTAVTE